MALYAIESMVHRHLLNQETQERMWEAMVDDLDKLFKLRDVCTVEELTEYVEDLLKDRYNVRTPYGFLDEVGMCMGAVTTRELESVVWHYLECEPVYPDWSEGGHGECSYDHGCMAKWGSTEKVQ